MAMTCSRCGSAIAVTDIQCPHCRLTLKAFGHPGIPLHRATEDASLCDTCTYHADDTCNFPQRPHAQTCTLYQDLNAPPPPAPIKPRFSLRRYSGWIGLGGLVLISLAIALSR